jgi:hypothetical protein
VAFCEVTQPYPFLLLSFGIKARRANGCKSYILVERAPKE